MLSAIALTCFYPINSLSLCCNPCKGIILYSFKEALQLIREEDAKLQDTRSTISLSFVGIASNSVYDLLAPTGANTPLIAKSSQSMLNTVSPRGTDAKTYEAFHDKISQEEPSTHQLDSYDDLVSLLLRGLGARHALFQRIAAKGLEPPCAIVTLSLVRRIWDDASKSYKTFASKLNFIDLPFSKPRMQSQSSTSSPQMSGVSVPESIMPIATVLAGIGSGQPLNSIPFADSKLTLYLKDSLIGKGSSRHIVASISPFESDLPDSLAVLKFANLTRRLPAYISTSSIDALIGDEAIATSDVSTLQQTIIRLRGELQRISQIRDSVPPEAAQHLDPVELERQNAFLRSQLAATKSQLSNLDRHYNFLSTELSLTQADASLGMLAGPSPFAQKALLFENGTTPSSGAPMLARLQRRDSTDSGAISMMSTAVPDSSIAEASRLHTMPSISSMTLDRTSSVNSTPDSRNFNNGSRYSSGYTDYSASDSPTMAQLQLQYHDTHEPRLPDLSRPTPLYRGPTNRLSRPDLDSATSRIEPSISLPTNAYIERLELQNKMLADRLQEQAARLELAEKRSTELEQHV
eukprot:jgi/Hompol1/2972/HPOL_006264-RA